MARVSVIMPAYNASQTSGRALESLRNQTYQDIEIIIVNDGSTDGTLEVIQEIARLDSRIVIVNQSNSGPGFARNAGLNKARSEFVYFMDSDDTIDADLIYKCVDYMTESNLDLLVFGFAVIDEHAVEVENVSFDDYLATNKEELALAYVPNFLMARHGNGFLWNKFYRRDIIEGNSIRFGTDKIMEDELFNIKYYSHTSRCRFINDVLYNYFWETPTSIRSKFSPTHLNSLVKVYHAFMTLKEEYHIKDEVFDKNVINRTWKGLVAHLLKNSESRKSRLKENAKTFNGVITNSTFQSVAFLQHETVHLSVFENALFYAIRWKNVYMYICIIEIYHKLKLLKSILNKFLRLKKNT